MFVAESIPQGDKAREINIGKRQVAGDCKNICVTIHDVSIH